MSLRTRTRRREGRARRFRTRCRLFAFVDHDGSWVVTCRSHGHLGAGTAVYTDWLAAIHVGQHPA